ncbi:MAG: WD40 repeat domain-containing protein [Armatimonadetes bacterium]|nr:WD40 repeat domain-containing protein [Armatimonadota bacterium]
MNQVRRYLSFLFLLSCLTATAGAQSRPDIVWQFGGTGGRATVSFSPDGETLATGGNDDTVKLWSVSEGNLLSTLSGHTYVVSQVRYSSDGETLASASRDYSAKLWRVSDGELLQTLEHPWHVTGIAWSPDDSKVATITQDGVVRVWNSSNGTLIRTLSGQGNGLPKVEFSPDGQYVASCGGTNTCRIHLWRVSDGGLVRIINVNANYLLDIAFSPDSLSLASANGLQRTVSVWSVPSGTLLNTLVGHSAMVWSVEFSPDGQILASGSGENERVVKYWSMPGGGLMRTLPAHTRWVESLAFHPSGSSLAVGGDDVRVWSVPDGGLLDVIGESNDRWAGVAFTPDGRFFVAAAAFPGKISVRNAADGTFVRDLQASAPSQIVISPDGQLYTAPTFPDDIIIRRFSDGAVQRVLQGHTRTVYTVEFSDDGQYAASGGGFFFEKHGEEFIEDTNVRLWRLSDGALLRTLSGHQRPIFSVDISPDGARVASAAADMTVLWRFSDGAVISGMPVGSSIVKFSPDGSLLAVAGGNIIHLFDGVTGALIRTLAGHASPVSTLAFTVDGKVLVSGNGAYGNEYRVKFWNVADGSLLLEYDREVGTGILSVALNPSQTLFGYSRSDPVLVVARNPFYPVPMQFSIIRGLLVSGGLPDLLDSDDSRLVVRTAVFAPSIDPPVQIEVVGTSPTETPSELRFRFEGMASRNLIERRISLYNYVTQSYEELHVAFAATSDEVVEIVVTSNASRFVEPGTGQVKSLMTWKAAAFSFFTGWNVGIDQTVWTITP